MIRLIHWPDSLYAAGAAESGALGLSSRWYHIHLARCKQLLDCILIDVFVCNLYGISWENIPYPDRSWVEAKLIAVGSWCWQIILLGMTGSEVGVNSVEVRRNE